MKQLLNFSIALLIMVGSASCNSQTNKNMAIATVDSTKIEVYYFHFTRRCVTCNAVESETKKAIEMLYPEKVKSSDITFASINLDEKSNTDLADKFNVSGQCLLITKGATCIDMTSKAFIYAANKPEKLQAEIKNEIDRLIK